MRLADQIVQRAAAPSGYPMDEDFKAVAKAIRGAVHYEVDASAGQLSFGTTEASPFRASAKTRSAAFPSKVCWFEWLGPSAKMGPHAHVPPKPGTHEPDRCGVLVESDETRLRGSMSFVWGIKGRELEPCPISVLFDWRADAQPVPDLRRYAFAHQGRSWRDSLKACHDASRFAAQPFEALVAEEERFGHIPWGLLARTWEMFTITSVMDPPRMRRILQGVFNDLEGEPIFVMGLLLCLCAPGLLEVTGPDDMARLNAVRRKRGKPDLLAFRRVVASGETVIRFSDRGGAVETMQGFHAA